MKIPREYQVGLAFLALACCGAAACAIFHFAENIERRIADGIYTLIGFAIGNIGYGWTARREAKKRSQEQNG
jgi:hypothetical protein